MQYFPVTSFENYMLMDNHPGYEMVVLMEYGFRGKINKDLLIEAYQRVAQYEPLLRAVVTKKKGKRYWSVDDKYLVPLTFETSDESVEQTEGTRYMVSLSPEERCSQIIVRQLRDGVLIDVYVHHAIGDGIGVHQFIADWMKEYDLLLHGQTDSSELNFHPDPDLFSRREEFHFTPEPNPEENKEPKKKKSFFSKILSDIYNGVGQFFCRRVMPILKNTKIDKLNLVEHSPMYWRCFGEDFFLKYKAKAKSFGASVNTLMIRDMYNALRKWIEKHPVDNTPVERQKRWFRMLIPMNIRTDFHRTVPCANILGYIFLDRRPADCNRSEEFLNKIQFNMFNCKKYHLGALFVSGLHFFEKIPGFISLMTSDRQCHCSVILSSVGNICKGCMQEDYSKNDDIRIEHDEYPLQLFRMLGAPPTRPHTPISIGVMQRQNEAFISCRYDLNVMTEETMLEFYNMFADEMMKSIE